MAQTNAEDEVVERGPRQHWIGRMASFEYAMGSLVAVWAAMLASLPLTDNSFFTHLATGRLILSTGRVPTTDPFTFTAAGSDWTVQSWLASVAFAGAERAAGGDGLRLIFLAAYLIAGLLLWRLSRPAESVAPRLILMAMALLVATDVWNERPYMIGVIGLACVWLALDGAIRPWLLVPLLWIWANVHGSFPLALILVVSVTLGAYLDESSDRTVGILSRSSTELRVALFTVVGTLAAVIGPLGLDVLLFPLSAVRQSELLAYIVEWQPAGYRTTAERVFLLLLVLAIASVVRLGRWRLTVPLLVFGAAAITSQRNIAMALVIIVPIVAAAAPDIGTLRSMTRSPVGAVLTVTAGLMSVLIAVGTLGSSITSFDPYPARPIAWYADVPRPSDDVRVATQDFAGNLLEVLDGARGAVFIDDRADMFPLEVFLHTRTLAEGGSAWENVLDDYDIDIVIWERDTPLGSLLATSPEWRVAFSDTEWSASCRRTAAVCRRLISH